MNGADAMNISFRPAREIMAAVGFDKGKCLLFCRAFIAFQPIGELMVGEGMKGETVTKWFKGRKWMRGIC